MTENKTAMRDAFENPVFVGKSGEYSEVYPQENIVDRTEGLTASKFIVYGFVGSNEDYEESEFSFETQKEAIDFATDIYGQNNVDGFERDGEVFEVEVHKL